MAYPDQKFYARPLVPWGFAVDFGLSVATTVAQTDVAAQLPKVKRRTKVNAVRLRCTAIPNASATALVASFLNGTDTFGTVTLTTATADQWLDVTITDGNATLAADVQPTVSVAGTATATDDSMGDFDVWVEAQEQFA